MSTKGLFLNETYLYKVLEQRPSKSKSAPTQRFIHQQLFPWKDFGVRDVLIQKAKSNNQLATPYGPVGQPTAPPRESGTQQLVTMMDWKAYDVVDPSVVQEDMVLGELAISGSLKTAQMYQNRVRDAVSRIIQTNANRIDNSLELVAIGALLNNFQWPPTDDAGSAISSPPNYWETDIGETSWTFGLPSALNQDISTLVDYNGSAATTAQKTYWSTASADIIGALEVMNQIANQTYGFSLRGGTILCRSTLLSHIIKNTAILNLIRGSNSEQPGARGYTTIPQLEAFFVDGLGYTFAPYDTFWTYESGLSKSADHSSTVVHYLKENQIIIIPPGRTQMGWMGTCPIEHQDESWKAGLMPWLYRDPRPSFRREAGVHTVAWPIFEHQEWATLQVLA